WRTKPPTSWGTSTLTRIDANNSPVLRVIATGSSTDRAANESSGPAPNHRFGRFPSLATTSFLPTGNNNGPHHPLRLAVSRSERRKGTPPRRADAATGARSSVRGSQRDHHAGRQSVQFRAAARQGR